MWPLIATALTTRTTDRKIIIAHQEIKFQSREDNHPDPLIKSAIASHCLSTCCANLTKFGGGCSEEDYIIWIELFRRGEAAHSDQRDVIMILFYCIQMQHQQSCHKAHTFMFQTVMICRTCRYNSARNKYQLSPLFHMYFTFINISASPRINAIQHCLNSV